MLRIEPGGPILEWHLWQEGARLAVHLGRSKSYGLYETTTGRLLTSAAERVDSTELPDWAKTEWQLSDESVPHGELYTEQRTAWIAKLLRQIDTLQPGMRRKDLLVLLTEEGGISTRYQRTYVSRDCPYIKVDVTFREIATDKSYEEKPDDIIESVSTPYLGWSVND